MCELMATIEKGEGQAMKGFQTIVSGIFHYELQCTATGFQSICNEDVLPRRAVRYDDPPNGSRICKKCADLICKKAIESTDKHSQKS